MRFFISNFKWVMLSSGLFTCSMFLGLFSPETLVKSIFGKAPEGAVEGIIARNWSALIGLMGIMLIYGAFNALVRRFVLVIAGISKIIFIILVLTSNQSGLGMGAVTAVITDAIMVVLYIVYLLVSRSGDKNK